MQACGHIKKGLLYMNIKHMDVHLYECVYRLPLLVPMPCLEYDLSMATRRLLAFDDVLSVFYSGVASPCNPIKALALVQAYVLCPVGGH